jgi:competence protein ComEC
VYDAGMKKALLLVAFCLVSAATFAAGKTLDVWVIDTEGGKAVLIVSPAGQSMLIDTGFPGSNDRDTNRILEACRLAGVKKLDVLLTTHYDLDHVSNTPSLVAKLPVALFVDHGAAVVSDPRTSAAVSSYDGLWTQARHLVVKPGDRIPFAGVDVQVLASAFATLKTPLKGAGQPNSACSGVQPRTWERTNEDNSENAASVATLFTFGSFRMLDMGDLTWNREMQLMCPDNRVGTVDLYLVNHHGADLSNNPALVNGIRARVAVMNNGARKGGSASVVALLKAAPGLQGFYMLHRSVSAANDNPPEAFLANLDSGSDGNWIRISAQKNRTMVVTNGRTGESRTYKR